MRQNKLSGDATLPIAGLRGLLAGFAVTIILFAVATFFVSGGKIPESAMRLTASACVFLGSLVGSFVSAKSYAHRRLFVGIGLSLAMFLICFIIAAISPSASFPSKWHLVLLVTFLASGAAGGLLAAQTPARRR